MNIYLKIIIVVVVVAFVTIIGAFAATRYSLEVTQKNITEVRYFTARNVGSTIILPNQPVYVQGSDDQNYPTARFSREPYCTCGQYAGVAVEEIPIGGYGKILKIKR